MNFFQRSKEHKREDYHKRAAKGLPAKKTPAEVVSKASKVVENKIYLFGKQQFQLYTLKDEVEVIITDSPLLLNSIYDKTECGNLKTLVLQEYHKYNNLLYYIERDTSVDYEEEGRYQDEIQAKEVDTKVENFLIENNILYKRLYGIGSDTLEAIYNDIKEELKK